MQTVTRGIGAADASVRAVRLHVIYRSTGPDNAKGRPPYHSKLRSLQSLLRSWDRVADQGSLVFLNNGPIPEDRLEVMRRCGRVEQRSGLELHESYWAAVSLACGLPDGDLVLFAEDDHLYRVEALVAVVDAARVLPGVSYFATYASTVAGMPNGEPLHAGLRVPAVDDTVLAEGWRRGLSHTSSFAVRVGALREDVRLHRLAPRCGGAWDHALALAYQGLVPYGPGAVFAALREPRLGSGSRRVKVAVWRAALVASSVGRRHRLAAARPSLSTHVETGVLALGTDWEAEASGRV
jgi:hypothetical protein